MNDVSEPLVVNKSYGGTGLDYHGVLQTSQDFIGYLINETGFGRLSLMMRLLLIRRERLALCAIYNVYQMLKNPQKPQFLEAWERVLNDLTQIYNLTKHLNIPVVLMIFPHRFQVGNKKLQKPQQTLKSHADQNEVSYLDITQIIEKHLIKGDTLDNIFLDQDHYTVHGHNIVAGELLNHLKEQDILTFP